MNKIVNGVANDYEFPMYYEPKISTNRQAGKTQQMFYELSIELSKKQQELDQYKNNWEELKEYLNNGINYWEEQEKEWIEQGFMKFGGEANTKIIYQGILNKMKELEEDK